MSPRAGAAGHRRAISIAVDPGLQGSLQSRAGDGVIVVDYFASQGCGVVVGDLTCDVRATAPGPDYIQLTPVEGVPVFAEPGLLTLLQAAGASLRLGGPPFARHLAVRLDRPELWIDFLECPGSLATKRRSRLRPA